MNCPVAYVAFGLTRTLFVPPITPMLIDAFELLWNMMKSFDFVVGKHEAFDVLTIRPAVVFCEVTIYILFNR